MYAGSGFGASELGDIDVVRVDNLYHLFHLVLPNHDYIAHAVSPDGLVWRRVRNALFIGDPGAWDDDMLWTMHVTRDPDNGLLWRMFYTGISRREQGRVQRIGAARSTDLYHWEKDLSPNYPLEIRGPHYESSAREGREWVSCRDPFFFRDGDGRYLLVAARTAQGPLIRRGCVGIAREVEPDVFEWLPPLFHPRMYDDVEVPGLYRIAGRYYLLGNLREDVKVHYWRAEALQGPYEAFCDNMLLPQGNYAARITSDEDGRLLVWSFFIGQTEQGGQRLLPPPKEILVNDRGELGLRSARLFDAKAHPPIHADPVSPIQRVLENATARVDAKRDGLSLSTSSGYEIFYLDHRAEHFRLRCAVRMEGRGKTGLVFRGNERGDAYFISLDLMSGLAQMRVWQQRRDGMFNNAFEYVQLQENHFPVRPDLRYRIELIAYGGYYELSVDGRVVLSLIDVRRYHDHRLGFYTESAEIVLSGITLEELDGPREEDYGPI